jgi:choline dehydrogenase-like flavoprotein
MRVPVGEIASLPAIDVCVIGSGPAGITVARKLADAGRTVALLEAGGESQSEAVQALYQGRVVGDRYFDLDRARLRCLGGTSQHWGGWCRPLDAYDFDAKAGLPETAWPIAKADLDPYLAQARSILEIDPIGADQPIRDTGLKVVHFAFSPPVRFAGKYGAALARHPNLHLVLHASVTRLVPGADGIAGVRVVGPDGAARTLRARLYVLATGGIENSRLLLWSNMQGAGRVVPDPATLGRYWMEHPHFDVGQAIVAPEWLSEPSVCNQPILAPTPATMARLGILNAGLRLPRLDPRAVEALVADLKRVAPETGRRAERDLALADACGARVSIAWEQEPRAENRVALGEETDRLGIPRPVLHWRKSAQDLHTARALAEYFGRTLAEAGQGRLKLAPWLADGAYPDDGHIAGFHHMGGTRMAASASHGIVDRDCRVFGQPNLFVAGSSVFPGAGHANPTLTIVQLALRLADRLLAA